jgi:signal peptidase I
VPSNRGTRRRHGRIVFWSLTGVCLAALTGGLVTAVATARTFSDPSASMESTVMPGDVVVVDRTAPVHRGDVIVEQQPSEGPDYFIRRVIGLPGDHVVCCAADGRITVNGKPLSETYVYQGDSPSPTRFAATVPAGDLWLLGDHRSVARDSRTEGPLAVNVIGRVFLVLRSWRAISVPAPGTFVAAGLAPAGSRLVPAEAGIGVAASALVLLVALTVFGIIRSVNSKRRGAGPELAPAEGAPWNQSPIR